MQGVPDARLLRHAGWTAANAGRAPEASRSGGALHRRTVDASTTIDNALVRLRPSDVNQWASAIAGAIHQLAHLNQAQSAQDMNVPGWRLHPLSGKLKGHWAVSVSGNWRLTFRLENGDAILVDYQDYH